MRLKDSIFFAFVVIGIASVSGGLIKHFNGCGNFKSKDQIQIYKPNGLRVTQKKTDKMVAFGIEVYINKPQSEPRVYDFWLNTTEVDPISNNFTLYEPTAVIREGDMFDYAIRKEYKSGNIHWNHCRAFRVNEKYIKVTREAHTALPDASIGEKKERSQVQTEGPPKIPAPDTAPSSNEPSNEDTDYESTSFLCEE